MRASHARSRTVLIGATITAFRSEHCFFAADSTIECAQLKPSQLLFANSVASAANLLSIAASADLMWPRKTISTRIRRLKESRRLSGTLQRTKLRRLARPSSLEIDHCC